MENMTREQADQSAIAQRDFEELLDRLVREGMDYRAILAGAATALTHSISVSVSPQQVPIYFAQCSAMTMRLAKEVDKH